MSDKPFPWLCGTCGRFEVRPKPTQYETKGVCVENLEVPTCTHCGEQWFDLKTDEQIQSALRNSNAMAAYEIPKGVEAIPVFDQSDSSFKENIDAIAKEHLSKDNVLDLAKKKEQTLRPGGCSYCTQYTPQSEKSAVARVVQYNGDKISYWEEYDEDGMLVFREETELKHI